MTTTFVHVKSLQREGICVRPPRGLVGQKILEEIELVLANDRIRKVRVLDWPDLSVTYAGAATYLRKLREKDPAKFGDVALGLRKGRPAVFLHGCVVIDKVLQAKLGHRFIRQSKMAPVLTPEFLSEHGLTEKEIQAIRLRFGLGSGGGLSLQETADAMNVERARVGQLLTSGLARLGLRPQWRLP